MNLMARTNRIGRIWGVVLAGMAASVWTATVLPSLPFSLQVVQAAASVPADAQKFVGTWTAEYQGVRFIVLDLRMEKGKLGGGMSMASNFHIGSEGSGEAIQIVDKTLLESLPARNFRVSDKSLTFDFTDPDGDETHWKLEVTGADAGRLSWVGLPDGMKAQPMPVKRSFGKLR